MLRCTDFKTLTSEGLYSHPMRERGKNGLGEKWFAQITAVASGRTTSRIQFFSLYLLKYSFILEHGHVTDTMQSVFPFSMTLPAS